MLLLDVRDQGTDSIVFDVITLTCSKSIRGGIPLEDVYYYLKANPKEYKTVVIDTVTQLGDMCIEYVMRDKRDGCTTLGD